MLLGQSERDFSKDEAAETLRSATHEAKQKWKELPGNRYTPEELQLMAESFSEFTMAKRKRKVMYID
jgi:hypothetical protein